MTRLPGHCDPRSSPENATAQTTPSRLTIVPHIWKSSPLLSAFTAAISALLRAAYDGRPEHALPPLSSSAQAADDTATRPKSSRHERLRFMLVSFVVDRPRSPDAPLRRAGPVVCRAGGRFDASNERAACTTR